MYQGGGQAPQGGGDQQMQMAQQLHQLLAQAQMIDPQQVSVEQIAQMSPEQMQQAAQQAQQKLQGNQQQMAQLGAYSDEESANILGGIAGSLGDAEVDESAVDSYYDAQSTEKARQKQARQDKAGKTAGDVTSASLPTALNIVGGATDKGEINKGSGAAIGSNMATRGGQLAAAASVLGPVGTFAGGLAGLGLGGVEGYIAGKQYRDDLVDDTQSARQVGALGNTLNVAAKGAYTRQEAAEKAYARSKANQSYKDATWTSNKLGLNSKVYAAGTKLRKSKMAKGGKSP